MNLEFFKCQIKAWRRFKILLSFFWRKEEKTELALLCLLEWRGGRPLLCEIQALTLKSYLAMPRRTSLGIDVGRLHLILAVLEKYFQIPFSSMMCLLIWLGV